ncbi:MAG: site-specific DNA-methyltransferase [Betaproteobacteria bacterium]|nr:site-specific DNA-methyltransferase [Betaproteobacteria bacterium]
MRFVRETGRPLFRPLKRKGEGKLTGFLGRWAGLGPYYAMFPMEFALKTVRYYCPQGGRVLDPFAGRGTSIYAAAAIGRTGVGIEVHPAGWIYGQVKLCPAPKDAVLARLAELAELARSGSAPAIRQLPEFFRWCFSSEVLRFLLAARSHLNWRRNSVDRTLMAFLLNNLHGDLARSLSNQMHQSRSMAPDYSVEWWRSKKMQPERKDPIAFLTARIEWRYKHGTPQFSDSKVRLGDSVEVLTELARRRERFDLLLTSPPYYAVVNYHYDQWLRLWLLGGRSRPVKSKHMSRGGFENMIDYQVLLHRVFEKAAMLLTPRAAVYVRTDAREFTLYATYTALQYAFPGRKIQVRDRPYQGKTQTELFGDKNLKPGEVDLVLSARRR